MIRSSGVRAYRSLRTSGAEVGCLACPSRAVWSYSNSGRLSNQGEKSINFYFIRVLLRKKY